MVANNQATNVYELTPPMAVGLGPGETFGEMRIKFHVDAVATATNGDDFTLQAYNGQEKLNVVLDIDSFFGGLTVFCGTGGTGGSPDTGVFVDWSGGSDYWLKWQYDGSVSRATIWRDGNPEPSTWLCTRSTVGDTPSATPNFEIDWNVVTSATHTLFFSEISVSGCAPVPPTISGPTFDSAGSTGFGCETPTRTSSTVYTTGNLFQPFSTIVYVAGVFQIRGSDYTEDTGGAFVTFSSPVSSSDAVRICYRLAVMG
jgi:hypothetical protein